MIKRYNPFNYFDTWIALLNVLVAGLFVFFMLKIIYAYPDQLFGIIFGCCLTVFGVAVCLHRAYRYFRKGINKARSNSDDYILGRENRNNAR